MSEWGRQETRRARHEAKGRRAEARQINAVHASKKIRETIQRERGVLSHPNIKIGLLNSMAQRETVGVQEMDEMRGQEMNF